jgi:hypothetical protein
MYANNTNKTRLIRYWKHLAPALLLREYQY